MKSRDTSIPYSVVKIKTPEETLMSLVDTHNKMEYERDTYITRKKIESYINDINEILSRYPELKEKVKLKRYY